MSEEERSSGVFAASKGDDITPKANNVRAAVDKYGDTLYRICIITLQNAHDAEDAVQETFISYFRKAPPFGDDTEREKAWLIRAATNKCRDILRYRKRHPADDEEKLMYVKSGEGKDVSILDALAMVPDKFRVVLALHYVNELKIDKIAGIIGKSPSAVKMRLQKGRRLLEDIYRKEFL